MSNIRQRLYFFTMLLTITIMLQSIHHHSCFSYHYPHSSRFINLTFYLPSAFILLHACIFCKNKYSFMIIKSFILCIHFLASQFIMHELLPTTRYHKPYPFNKNQNSCTSQQKLYTFTNFFSKCEQSPVHFNIFQDFAAIKITTGLLIYAKEILNVKLNYLCNTLYMAMTIIYAIYGHSPSFMPLPSIYHHMQPSKMLVKQLCKHSLKRKYMIFHTRIHQPLHINPFAPN